MTHAELAIVSHRIDSASRLAPQIYVPKWHTFQISMLEHKTCLALTYRAVSCVYLSAGISVRQSVRVSVCPSVRPAVHAAAFRASAWAPFRCDSHRFASYRIVSHRIVSYRIVKCRASHIVSCCREGVSCDRRVCVREVEPWVLRIHITTYGLDSSARHVPYRVMTSSNESCLKLYAAPHHISAYPPFCPPIHPPDSPSRLPARPPCQYSGRTSARRCGRRRGPHRARFHIGGHRILSCRVVLHRIISYRRKSLDVSFVIS
jgi:hypothetical protein